MKWLKQKKKPSSPAQVLSSTPNTDTKTVLSSTQTQPSAADSSQDDRASDHLHKDAPAEQMAADIAKDLEFKNHESADSRAPSSPSAAASAKRQDSLPQTGTNPKAAPINKKSRFDLSNIARTKARSADVQSHTTKTFDAATSNSQLTSARFGLGKRQKTSAEPTVSTTQTNIQRKALTKIGGQSNTNSALYVLSLLLVIAGLWYWFNREPSQAPAEPTTVASVPAASEANTPAASNAMAQAHDSTDTAKTSAAATASAPVQTMIVPRAAEQAPQVANGINLITPEEILAPELPQDPTLAKEELDRLDEQSSQLADQQAMMNEQLDMMHELSSKKAERIQLLEQRIAELERQQAAPKSVP